MPGVSFCVTDCWSAMGGGGGGGAQCATALTSTLVRHTGTGSEAILAGARSVTLTVIAGDVNVSIGGGPSVTVPAGWTQTWSGDNCGDNLSQAFSFTGVSAMSDFTVASVRQ